MEWYLSLIYRDKGVEYIAGQYTYYGWCYKIEMAVFKNIETEQVYNYFPGHGTAVKFLIFGKTITRNFLMEFPFDIMICQKSNNLSRQPSAHECREILGKK